MAATVVKHATCLGCGCACDDIEVHADGERVTLSDNACPLGEAWFRDHSAARTLPDALIDGQPTTLDDAIAEAAEVLSRADLPLVYDHGFTNCEAQRAAVALAEAVGGVIDSYTSMCHGPSFLATQLVGKVSCTLGEVKNRGDVLLFWGCDPATTHPRHLSRYSADPKGGYTPRGRRDRTVIVVDVEETAKQADVFLRVRAGADFEALTALLALLKGQPVRDELVAETGLSVDQLRGLLDRLKAAKFGVLFFGRGLVSTRGGHGNAAAAYLLAMEMNAVTKFDALPMREHGNLVGSDMVLRWTAGYPFGVIGRGYPRSNPGEHTTTDLLGRGEVDAALLLGHGVAEALPPPAAAGLALVPRIVLASKVSPSLSPPRVHITTSTAGVSAGGTVCRMDDIPLPLRPALRSPYPTDEDVLNRILRAVSPSPAWYPAAPSAN